MALATPELIAAYNHNFWIVYFEGKLTSISTSSNSPEMAFENFAPLPDAANLLVFEREYEGRKYHGMFQTNYPVTTKSIFQIATAVSKTAPARRLLPDAEAQSFIVDLAHLEAISAQATGQDWAIIMPLGEFLRKRSSLLESSKHPNP